MELSPNATGGHSNGNEVFFIRRNSPAQKVYTAMARIYMSPLNTFLLINSKPVKLHAQIFTHQGNSNLENFYYLALHASKLFRLIS